MNHFQILIETAMYIGLVSSEASTAINSTAEHFVQLLLHDPA